MPGVELVTELKTALERHAPGVERVLVAVSGGPDSVALVRLMADVLRAEPGRRLQAVHVAHFDHGLREDSARDAAFTEALADSLGFPYHGGSAPVAAICRERGWNVAAGARTLRYEFLTRTARHAGIATILTAHTRDDQAETVLQQLLRGTAYASGMPARRGSIVRPLLSVPHEELLAYLERIGQEYVSDPSNVDTSRLRPWLRHEILPRLDARVGDASSVLARHALVQRDVEAFMREESVRRFGTDGVDVDRLAAAPVALQREAIAALLDAHAAPTDFALIERIRAHLHHPAPYRLDVARGATVRIAYGRLEVVEGPAPGRLEERSIARPADLPADAPPGLLDVEGPLVLRTRQPGDVIRLAGGTKKVADLLIDRKVPREARDALPMIARGSEVLWIEGVATAAEIAPVVDPDRDAMDRALELAREGGEAGELPVGAVVVLDDEVVAGAHNESERQGDPTAHAEMLALRRAADRVGRHRFPEASLVVTLEPCPMCLGAVLQAHVGRVVYGAANRRDGALGGVTDLTEAPWKRTVEVRGGVRAREASALLQAFFGARR